MNEKKDSVIRFRCTVSERKRIEKLAKPFGSISNFLLCSVLTDKKVIIDPKTFLKGMNELSISINRVGNNVNQIARFLNTTKDIENYPLMKDWLNSFSEYKEILLTVKKKLDEIYKIT